MEKIKNEESFLSLMEALEVYSKEYVEYYRDILESGGTIEISLKNGYLNDYCYKE